LIELWPHIINNHSISKKDLATWLEGQNTIQVKMAQKSNEKNTQSEGLIKLLEATLAQNELPSDIATY